MGEEDDEDEDDDDFEGANIDYEKMCLDQLVEGASAGQGGPIDYDDVLEEDDEVRSGEDDLEIEEEPESSEGPEKTGGRTAKSETFKHLRVDNNNNFTESARRQEGIEDSRRGSKHKSGVTTTTTTTTATIKNKGTAKKKETRGYNEGAEEHKEWEDNFTDNDKQKLDQLMAEHYQQEVTKAEVGPDG